MSPLMHPLDKPRVKLAELAMTPLIDCVFLLLAFFMVGMKFREIDRQLETRLPAQGPERIRPPVFEILIEVRNAGSAAEPRPLVLIERRPVAGWAAARSLLSAYARHGGGLDSRVVIAPADDAAHGWVVKVFDILNELGYRNVGFRR